MKKLLFVLLIASVPAVAQDTTKAKQAIPVILECARKDVISSRFFVPAVKIGDKFFYGNRKTRPLPKTWFVWNWKPINEEVAKS